MSSLRMFEQGSSYNPIALSVRVQCFGKCLSKAVGRPITSEKGRYLTPTLQKINKAIGQHKDPINISITQRLWSDLGRSSGATSHSRNSLVIKRVLSYFVIINRLMQTTNHDHIKLRCHKIDTQTA